MSSTETLQTKASNQEGAHHLSGVKTPDGSGPASDDDKDVLFRPWALGKYHLQNRIVYAPLTRCRAANPGKVPQDNAIEYYSQRALGSEGGLIITEAAAISETAHGSAGPICLC